MVLGRTHMGGKLWIPFRDRSSQSSLVMSQAVGMLTGSGPSESMVTSPPLRCNLDSFSATAGSDTLARPLLRRCLAALKSAPSSTRPLMVSST